MPKLVVLCATVPGSHRLTLGNQVAIFDVDAIVAV
jgi:hypothetical protein